MEREATTNPLLQQIDLGFQVEAFLQSDIGRYVTSRAESQVDELVEQLKTASPDDPVQIRSIQTEIKVAETVLYWLAEAIQSGINAQADLHDQGA